MRTVKKRPQAKIDLYEAALYLASEADLEIAVRFLKAAENAFTNLSLLPGLGAIRHYPAPELRDLRIWPIPAFPKYLIFYVVRDEEIEILRVLHGAQNVEEILSGPR